MEIKEEDYDTVVTFRVPISVAKQVDSLDWGLSRRKRSKSKAYLTAVQDGIRLRGLMQIQKDPKKKGELEKKFKDILISESNEQVLETMDVSGLELLIAQAGIVKDKKVNQLILDV